MTKSFEREVERFYRDLTGIQCETAPLFCWAFSNPDWIEGDVYLPPDICSRIRMFLPPTSYKQLPVLEVLMSGLITSYAVDKHTTLTVTSDALLEFTDARDDKTIILNFELNDYSAPAAFTLYQYEHISAVSEIARKLNVHRNRICLEYKTKRFQCTVADMEATSTVGCRFVFADSQYTIPGTSFDLAMNDAFMLRLADSITPSTSKVWLSSVLQGDNQSKVYALSITGQDEAGAGISFRLTIRRGADIDISWHQCVGELANKSDFEQHLSLLFCRAF